MGNVPIFCHICEGPADVSAYGCCEGEPLANSDDQRRVSWMSDLLGLTEPGELSAVWEATSREPITVLTMVTFRIWPSYAGKLKLEGKLTQHQQKCADADQ